MMEDWRFQKCPYVEHGGLQAYAGAPLRLQNESGDCVALGSLCVASSTSQEPLTKQQQNTLARLADWVVSDIIQCARARRQRDRRRMAEFLATAQREMETTASEEPVLQILRKTYPQAVISIRSAKSGYIDTGEQTPLSLSDVEEGLWEDTDYLDDLITNSNHKDLPRTRVVRIITAKCESIAGQSSLVVGSKDFRLVFDDVDSWFVQTCASMLSQMWHKRLLVEAIAAKESFLRGFSHQLRTPIHGILSSVELLAEELTSRDSHEQSLLVSQSPADPPAANSSTPSVYLDTIKTAGRDLISIVNSMITLNRWADIAIADRKHVIHSVYELETELVTEITKVISGITHYGVSIIFNYDLSLGYESFRFDLSLLRDSVLPLLINAVQNTSEGIIRIHISTRPDSKELVIDVQDTGCGIHPDHQQRIFEPYERVDIHSRGIGLGLTLASKFAALLQGSVVLMSSRVGYGSHFRATFQEVAYIYSSTSIQTLASRLKDIPPKFAYLTPASNDASLSDGFTKFLACNGFTFSELAEECFYVFESVSDLEQHRTHLSQMPSDQVAICLIPASEEDLPFDHAANVVYLSGPFSSSAMRSALEEADRLLSSLKFTDTTRTLTDKAILEEAPRQSPAEIHVGICKDTITLKTHEISLVSPMEPRTAVPRYLNLTSTPKPTTLLVDDSVINLRILQMYCKKRGLPYHSATDGLQAVEIFSRQQTLNATGDGAAIQLILMDLQMPLCDGIEATRRIRLLEKENKWAKSVLFIVTGQDGPNDRAAADNVGAHDYFVKPVGVKLLDRYVKRHFPAFTAG
jgi:signal transduction histidine kinase/CheY-like chemotaxis protein